MIQRREKSLFERFVSRGRVGRVIAVTGVAATALAFGGLPGAPAAAAAPLPAGCTQNGQTVTCSYSYTGSEQLFTVPAKVRSVTITAVGAAGGTELLIDGDTTYTYPGGHGATVSGTTAVTPRSTLYVEVGGTGSGSGMRGGDSAFNGGGIGQNGDGGGGGASDVRTASGGGDPSAAGLSSRLIVGAGGGGAGSAPPYLIPDGDGGAAGADGLPQESPPEPGHGQGGRAATQTTGGAGGDGEVNDEPEPGQPGTLGRGGESGGFTGGGGGGGGLYGGGGGGAGPQTSGGGGGGSSLVPSGGAGPTVTDAAAAVTISYTAPAGTGPSAPTITTETPSSGPAQGNTPVVLNGSGLVDVTSVTVDGTTVPYTAAANGRTLRFRTPAHPAGQVPVVVTTAAGSASTTFTYTPQPAPTITGESPTSGPARGHTAVRLTGTDFVGVTSVTVGGTSVDYKAAAQGRTITFRTPAHAAGAVPVVVTTTGGSASATFTYT